eukprot:gene190-352_t
MAVAQLEALRSYHARNAERRVESQRRNSNDAEGDADDRGRAMPPESHKFGRKPVGAAAPSALSELASRAASASGAGVAEYESSKQTNAVTRLQNLYNSQYVGAIGVGTVSRPAGCVRDRARAGNTGPVQFVANAFVSEPDECHYEEQTTINVVFDSGSTNLWIASDLCTTDPCTEKERHSESFRNYPEAENLDIEFGNGELRGTQGIDDFHVGPFTVKHQTFGLIAEEVGDAFPTS